MSMSEVGELMQGNRGIRVYGCGSKLNRTGYAGFGLCFHLPGFHFGTGFLSHSHIHFGNPLQEMQVVSQGHQL